MSEPLLNSRIAISKRKSADEDLKALGYDFVVENENIITYKRNENYLSPVFEVVFFDKNLTVYSKLLNREGKGEVAYITPDEHKAITEKMKELGWLDER